METLSNDHGNRHALADQIIEIGLVLERAIETLDTLSDLLLTEEEARLPETEKVGH